MYRESEELYPLCSRIRENLEKGLYKQCREEICYAMYLHPDAPEPHNLLGILLELQQDHTWAIRHFKAALDLDPDYLPARQNLLEYTRIGTRERNNYYALSDCPI